MIQANDQENLGKDFWGLIDSSVQKFYEEDRAEMDEYLQGTLNADKPVFFRAPSQKETNAADLQLDQASVYLDVGAEADDEESEETVPTGEEEAESSVNMES
ncbi:hypothetical protein HDU85_003858 [Gaertneriomyces sp. JEL0708]|nr:hypothetical protein HDU85_003858 [Gaertneriomyces sp. JEL0708]